MPIRPTEPRDLPDVVAIYNHEIEHGVAHFGTTEYTLAEAQDDFERLSPRYPAFVFEDGGHAIAFAKSSNWKTRGAYAWSTEITVYVHHQHTGRGIGRALYDTLIPELRERGFRLAIAGITLPNPASERLHEAIGMRKVAEFPFNGFKHGAWRGVGYWALDLNPVADDEPLPLPKHFA